jgi:ubiquinone/menaquinone biosynthesis C-methylase UbiE
MTKPYHKYVFSSEAAEFRGDFEGMYKNEDVEGFDSWSQDDVTLIVRQMSLAIIGRYNHSRILDIGCGKGTFTHLLKKQNNHVKGVDISPTALRKARTRYPSLDFAELDLRRIDTLAGEHFDLTVAMAVLYYLEHWKDALATVARFSDNLYVTLYVPPNTMGFVPSIDDFLAECSKHFTPETEVIFNRNTLLLYARKKSD